MTLVTTLIHLLIILLLARAVWKRQAALRKYYWPAFTVKIVAGVCLGLVYTWYYSVADTFAYFEDGKQLASLAVRDFPSYVRIILFNDLPPDLILVNAEPRAFFLTKITSVFNILTLNNYWVIGLYYSMFSFWGAWFLVTTINRHIPAAGRPAVIAFLFLPSVVFWSSGLLKESLAMPCLYFVTALVLKQWFGGKASIVQYILVVCCLWILWQLKYYYVAIFLPVACTTLVYKYVARGRLALSAVSATVTWLGLLLVPVILISFVHPNFHPDRLLEVIVVNNAAFHELSDPRDIVHFQELRADPASIIRNAPWALFSGLFRPLVWDVSSIIQVLPALENTVILILFIAALFRGKGWSATHGPLVLAAIVYVTLLAILITLSAPNFGTLSRYKVGYISFFVLLILSNNPLTGYFERSIRRLVSH